MNEVPVIAFRFPPEDARLLRQVAENRGEDMSSFVRRAVYTALAELGYLEERAKDLGLEG